MSFLVPNALDANSSYRQAEPDAVDWQVLGDRRHGVLNGLTVGFGSGMQLNIAAGTAVINGVIHTESGQTQVTIQNGGASDRFDLICMTISGPAVILGTPSADPVFPDVANGLQDTHVVLAAVYVASGETGPLSGNDIVDKRVVLMQGARGVAGGSNTFLHNKTDTVEFKVTGNGTMAWGGTDVLSGISTGLTVSGTLDVTDDLTVIGALSGSSADFTGNVTGDNLRMGSGNPSGSATAGTIYQDSQSGSAWVKLSTGNDWAQIAADEYPPGTVITMLVAATNNGSVSYQHLAGDTSWAAFGQTLVENTSRILTRVPAGWVSGSNVALPDMAGVFLMGTDGTASGGSNSLTLTESQMPAHTHLAGTATANGGGHTHTVTASSGGAHTHPVQSGGSHTHSITDNGHKHDGLDMSDSGIPHYFTGAAWYGQNKLDALFSDASHTWTVDMAMSTIKAYTGIAVNSTGSSHSHALQSAGDHTHSMSVNASDGHTHALPNEQSRGSSQPFDNRPSYLSVYYYIKL